MQKLKIIITSQEIYKAIWNHIPDDHSRSQSIHCYIKQIFSKHPDITTILDLGCGEGDSVDLFGKVKADVIWYGVDIEGSPEVKKRLRKSDSIYSFDGVNLPHPDCYFDLIFCHQVLEHVRNPDSLIKDAFRVLKPNGFFVGSVSYMEPYHSYSIFNFTPYGIARVFGDAGFDVKEIRPGVDAWLLINRQLFNRSKILRPIWNHNFLYGILGLIGSLFCLGQRERNFLKIQFSGHLLFLARRPDKEIRLGEPVAGGKIARISGR